MTPLSYPKYIYIYINVHTLLICLLEKSCQPCDWLPSTGAKNGKAVKDDKKFPKINRNKRNISPKRQVQYFGYRRQ